MVDRESYEAPTTISSSDITPSTSGGSGKNYDEGTEVLSPDFVPGKWDVICQRGKECFDHVGNRRFRMCIDKHLSDYMKVKSRPEKSRIVSAIVESIRKGAAKTGGGFVRKDLLTRRWFRVGDKLAREKVGQALRDAIKTRRASSDGPADTPANKQASGSSLHDFSDDQSPMPSSRRQALIPGLNFQPLEPREDGPTGASSSSDSLWSILKADASEKLKHPSTSSSFWEMASATAPKAASQHKSAAIKSHSKQVPASHSSQGGNEHQQGTTTDFFEPTPIEYQSGGSNLSLPATGFESSDASLAYAPPQLRSLEHPQRAVGAADVYSNSEASRKKVLGMFQSMFPQMSRPGPSNNQVLPPRQHQSQLPSMGSFAEQSLQHQQQQQAMGSIPLSMEGQFFSFQQAPNHHQPLDLNLLQARFNQRRSSADWYTEPASDDVFDLGKSL